MALASGVRANRPVVPLPWTQLGLISVYWFGINAIWGAYEGFGQKQLELMVGRASVGTVMGPLELLGGIVAILVVPTVGSLSDYTTSRFGKRKGYIITGATFDLLFIGGLALLAMAQPPDWDGQALGSTQVLLLYALLFLGLQFSSNVAQGPYQGFVPDLVAEPQVGIASGLVGVMRTIGLVTGFAIMAVGARSEAWGLAFLTVGLIEFILAAADLPLRRRRTARGPAERAPLAAIARETWDPGILRERSFVRMTLVRFLFLMGTGTFINISLLYLERVFGVTDPGERSVLWMAALGMALAGTIVAALVGARVSDRTGRKPVVWGAAAIAATGITLLAVAPGDAPAVGLLGSLFLGAGSGAYLAVDWALMTEIIPLAASGRYMGIANIANSLSGPIGLAIAGPIMDAFFRAGRGVHGSPGRCRHRAHRAGPGLAHPHRRPPATRPTSRGGRPRTGLIRGPTPRAGCVRTERASGPAAAHYPPMAAGPGGDLSSRVMVGRDAEARRLTALLAAVLEGTPRIIVVSGEAGVGKTRLIEECLARTAPGSGVLRGECLALGTAIPYLPFAEILRDLVRQVPATSLAGLLGSTRGELARLLPELAQAGGTASTTPTTSAPGMGDLDRLRLYEAFLRATERIAAEHPTVFVIEDIQWIDNASLELLSFLAHGLRQHQRAGLIVSVRSEDAEDRQPILTLLADLGRGGFAERIHLEVLDVEGTRDLIRSIQGTAPDDRLVARLHALSDGNPLFIEALMAMPGIPVDDSLPPGLRDLLAARLTQVPDDALSVLRVAACAGRTIDDRLLVAASGLSPGQVQRAVRAAVADHILVKVPGRPGYRFRHEILRALVASQLLPDETRSIHAAYASALLTEPTDRSDTSELASHWDAAGDWLQALAAHVAAGRVARGMLADDEAAHHFLRALELWSRVPGAETVAGVPRNEVLAAAAATAARSGDLRRAIELTRELLRDPGRLDPETTEQARSSLRWYLWESGDLEEALAEAEIGRGRDRLVVATLAGQRPRPPGRSPPLPAPRPGGGAGRAQGARVRPAGRRDGGAHPGRGCPGMVPPARGRHRGRPGGHPSGDDGCRPRGGPVAHGPLPRRIRAGPCAAGAGPGARRPLRGDARGRDGRIGVGS